MNNKQRKKAVRELKEKIIPNIKARNLANNPDKNLKSQGVFRAKALFKNFDFESGEKLENLTNELLEFERAGTRKKHVQNLAEDIVNYISSKTEEMDSYQIKDEKKNIPNSKITISNSQLHFGQGNNANQNNIALKKDSDKSVFLYVVGIITIIGVIWSMYIYFNPNTSKQLQEKIESTFSQDTGNNLATTTLNISELFSKALSMETVVERQDFLTKYIGDQIHGKGTVKQISRIGNDKFLVDIKVNEAIISCQQDNSEENEKRLLLLNGKTVNFYGIFTYQNIFEHGLEIKDCQIY